MLISEYGQFVQDTDQTVKLKLDARRDIAIYGLASEIGSVASAIKKQSLHEAGVDALSASNAEIVEELGDVMWYCFALARLVNQDKPVNIFIHDITKLRQELAADDARAHTIHRVIGSDNRDAFLQAAEGFRRSTRVMTFSDYQSVAFLTARTENKTLVEVCIAVLYQLSAELFRKTLPDIELELNRSLGDRPINDVLGEIAWHIAALASVYDIDLNVVAKKNIEKVSYRQNRSHPTDLHDVGFEQNEQFPRKFEVAFVTVGKGKAQMYWNGRRLGDQLTDNSYNDDGYRFHDVMHLANVAHLGWSPVVRGLMGRKRKSKPAVDEVEDGARAKIVEEAVIKTIHSEGERLAALTPALKEDPPRLFPRRSDITFKFLKLIQSIVSGLEVDKNRYWEWENTIIEGYEIFYRLRSEGQGTVEVDLERRSLKFFPYVYIPLAGRVVGLGSAAGDQRDETVLDVKKRAVLCALGVASATADDMNAIDLEERGSDEVSVKAVGRVREAMWAKKVVSFRINTTQLGGGWYCTALALSDD
jgi:NTP pyrophosphatase (non-canonical NTP hydrolase)